MPEKGVVAAHYAIDSSRPGPVLAGGLRAFAVSDRRDGSRNLIAVQTRAERPARAKVALKRGAPVVPHVVLPVDQGPGIDPGGVAGWFLICEALPGPAAGGQVYAWREQELIGCVLLPAAAALVGLQAADLTHRAINADNLFRAGPRKPVTLGPFWAAPAGSLQPMIYEPLYLGRCLPAARGAGVIADDVYALGVTLLRLAVQREPLAGLSDAAVLARKGELGSFEALTADLQLPPMIEDLVRGMLADDPEHRPSPAMLLNPEQARARRVAARPPRRAQTPLNVGGTVVWRARELAQALGQQPERGYALLKSGEVDRWLRRCLGDAQLGVRVEEATRFREDSGPDDPRQQNVMVMQAVAAIDPLAPMVWRGNWVEPDGIGPALAGAGPELSGSLQEAVASGAVEVFLTTHARRGLQPGQREQLMAWRSWLSARGVAGGLRRLIYGMNPLLMCQSPLLAGSPVVQIGELLPALDAVAATSDRAHPPIDAHVAAFIVARAETALTGELAGLSSFAGPVEQLAVLRVFGQLQARLGLENLPGLAGWLLACGFASLEHWRSRKTRDALREELEAAAGAGAIADMLALVDDRGAQEADHAGAEAARGRVIQLQEAVRGIEQGDAERGAAAERLGYEIATGVALVATLGAVFSLALR